MFLVFVDLVTVNQAFVNFQVGRANLSKLCLDLLGNNKVTVDLVEPIVAVLNKVELNREARIQKLAEIIAELRDPMKDKVEEEEIESSVENTPTISNKVLDDQNRVKQVSYSF